MTAQVIDPQDWHVPRQGKRLRRSHPDREASSQTRTVGHRDLLYLYKIDRAFRIEDGGRGLVAGTLEQENGLAA